MTDHLQKSDSDSDSREEEYERYKKSIADEFREIRSFKLFSDLIDNVLELISKNKGGYTKKIECKSKNNNHKNWDYIHKVTSSTLNLKRNQYYLVRYDNKFFNDFLKKISLLLLKMNEIRCLYESDIIKLYEYVLEFNAKCELENFGKECLNLVMKIRDLYDDAIYETDSAIRNEIESNESNK